ncbi:MAG: hypothetical protein F6K54_20245 [Okeania sp. SIO3B5]|nr:hypothetical protein [Okeania sp. SIO3B5]
MRGCYLLCLCLWNACINPAQANETTWRLNQNHPINENSLNSYQIIECGEGEVGLDFPAVRWQLWQEEGEVCAHPIQQDQVYPLLRVWSRELGQGRQQIPTLEQWKTRCVEEEGSVLIDLLGSHLCGFRYEGVEDVIDWLVHDVVVGTQEAFAQYAQYDLINDQIRNQYVELVTGAVQNKYVELGLGQLDGGVVRGVVRQVMGWEGEGRRER